MSFNFLDCRATCFFLTKMKWSLCGFDCSVLDEVCCFYLEIVWKGNRYFKKVQKILIISIFVIGNKQHNLLCHQRTKPTLELGYSKSIFISCACESYYVSWPTLKCISNYLLTLERWGGQITTRGPPYPPNLIEKSLGDVQSCAEHLLPPVRKQRLSPQPSTSISFYKL